MQEAAGVLLLVLALVSLQEGKRVGVGHHHWVVEGHRLLLGLLDLGNSGTVVEVNLVFVDSGEEWLRIVVGFRCMVRFRCVMWF